ncbi:MAG TPA: RNA polymerase subunit sigma-70 [Micromonosporaceae bacterium]|nr:RNA polymerase subunit sigma-70 [Micromonosporaceae bacterium]
MTISSRPGGPADTASTLAAAAAGDDAAFAAVTERHRRELLVHCYRMLGSLDDAEDAVQEALLKAWRGLPGYEGRSTLRAWLYRIATNVCLDAFDHRARRVLPAAIAAAADPRLPPAPDDDEIAWLQPYPDILLEVADPDPATDPAIAAVRREHIELAFVAAIQFLPPRRRAVLLLRDVLGFTAVETATMTGTSPASVNNALLRARAGLAARRPAAGADATPPAVRDELVRSYLDAWHAADVPALVALLCEDADMSMPPTPSWDHGRDRVGIYLRRLFAGPWGHGLRLVPTAANRQPALAVYAPAGGRTGYEPFAIKVLNIHNGLISAVTGFVHPGLFRHFGLPAEPDLHGPADGNNVVGVA